MSFGCYIELEHGAIDMRVFEAETWDETQKFGSKKCRRHNSQYIIHLREWGSGKTGKVDSPVLKMVLNGRFLVTHQALHCVLQDKGEICQE